MNDVERVVAATIVGAFGLWLVGTGLMQRRPALVRMSHYLARRPTDIAVAEGSGWSRFGMRLYRGRQFPNGVLADLRLVQTPPEAHAAFLVAVMVAGFFAPAIIIGGLQAAGVVSLAVFVPVGLCILAAVLAPLVLHSSMRTNARVVRRDLRYQLSAYLDVVTMLLSANMGNEGALRDAANDGDGRLFIELRQRIVIAEATNRSLVTALSSLGDDLDLVELQQIAASASLGSSAGAPMSRSLTAKCATLRSSLASEQEAEARVKSTKITIPLVGMALLFMTAIIYPALAHT